MGEALQKKIVIKIGEEVSEGGHSIKPLERNMSRDCFQEFIDGCKRDGLFIPQMPSVNQSFHLINGWVIPAFFRANTVKHFFEVVITARTLEVELATNAVIHKLRCLLESSKKEDLGAAFKWLGGALLNATKKEKGIIKKFILRELVPNINLL